MTQSASAFGIYGTHDNWPTTLAAAISTTSQISITLSSATNMPGGSAWNNSAVNALYKFSGSYAMPGGNMIQVDSEIMIVTAGWGTTTLTVTRGAESTTAATHSNGATVRWEQDYYSNNITFLNPAGACRGDPSAAIDKFLFVGCKQAGY